MTTLSRLAIVALASVAAAGHCATYYVAPNGSDLNAGTIEQPFRTIQQCAATASTGSSCLVRAGTYRETVTPNSGILIGSYAGEAVTVDGADPVTGWTVHQGAIYKASVVMSDGDTNQVFVGQEMMTEARWPNGHDLFHVNWATAQSGTSETLVVDSNLPSIDWTGAKVHIWSGLDAWSPLTGSVVSSSPGQLTIGRDGASIVPWVAPMAGGLYYVFGTLGALDSEREWFYDKTSHVLYFWAPSGIDPNTLDVRVKQRQHAFDLSGKNNVTIQRINLFASAIKTNGLSANNVIDGINATYVSHYTALPDDFFSAGSGGYAHVLDSGIVLDGSANVLKNSVISYSAGNGVAVVGTGSVVQNNLIHHVDYMGGHPSGITVLHSGTIRNNTVHDSGRFLMHLKIFQGNTVADLDVGYNNLYGAMMRSRDGGAIYAGGPPDVTRARIHHNWVHDTQDLPGPGPNFSMTGIYLDEGASGWEADQNIIWNNQFSINSHGNSSGATAPITNNLHNNTVLDVSPRAYIYLNQIPNCGSTQVVDNFVLLPVTLDDAAACAPNVAANGPTAAGANEMTASVQVGCNFVGCSSSTPPLTSGNLVAASIATPPYDMTVGERQPATFTAAAHGSEPLSYQWQINGVDINGATGASYTTSPVTPADSGTLFSVRVANALGAVSSTPAKLTVRSISDCLFSWAERTYPQHFAPPAAASVTYPPYYYRYYSGTGNFLATSSADTDIWVLGPLSGDSLLDVGPAENFMRMAGCSAQ